ncbi:tectonic-1 isoform X1 [Bicyclus anynana]|uniref:Tectonic-1 isoform X1 n=1 Tax=Bicyclus anynana TaxID=110368 RepID=A0A6J1NUM1_BICAN|nr:tectonic-1 isoform X1 [Bicyclus anynana]
MNPITYLCFTLLSIVIQFCLMDFINEQIRVDNTVINSNSTVVKNSSDIFDTIKQKPHALYYRKDKNELQIKRSPVKYENESLSETSLTSSTELVSTVFDLLYDENVSVTESDLVTDAYFTSSEFDNVTEITFFDKKPSTEKPTVKPKKISTNECYCNLLYKTCDINCCCDNDCSDLEKSVLKSCEGIGKDKCEIHKKDNLYMCSSHFSCSTQLQSDIFGYLFCIGKVNLPDIRKTIKHMPYALDVDNHLKWHISEKNRTNNMQLTKNRYTTGQPVLLVTKDGIHSLELPMTLTNEYCNSKKTLKFLRNDNIKCYVKLKDLHMLDVIKSYGHTKVASPKESTINSTKLDCTTLHCVNRTFLICDEHRCTEYNNELHEPSCSDSHCNNIGVKVEYEFYCNASLITRVIVKFHVQIISMDLEYVSQEITVKFYMGNNSIESIIKFSGNPGYIKGLPIIVTSLESNRTENFYNTSIGKYNNHILLPSNKDGECVLTNLTHNILKFGHNKRIKCRTHFKHNFTINNGTDGCMNIQTKIDGLYGFSKNIYISPYGNPQGVSDENWISLQNHHKRDIHGEYHRKDANLICYNLVTRIAFTIAYTDTNEANKEINKIISARVDSTTKNISFSIEDLSIVITIDTNFIDASKTTVHEYIEAHFNFHLPKDFFYPSSSSKGSFVTYQNIVLFLCYFVLQIK